MIQTKRLAALCLAGSMLLLSACGTNGDGSSSAVGDGTQSTAVEVQTVAQGEMAASNTLAGQVQAAEAVQVFPMLSGLVETLSVAEGDTVTRGQTLFTVDTSTVTSTLSALQQSYSATKSATDQAIASAQIGVETAQLGVESAQLSVQNAQSSAENAQLAVDQAQTALDNVNALFAVGAASSQQVTQAEQGLQQAQAALQQAQTGVQQAQASVQSAQAGVQQAQAGVQQAQASQQSSLAQIQASIDQIRAQAALGTVTAPVSGRVTAVNITLGSMAAQTSPAVIIAEDNALVISVFTSENVRSGLQVGDIADVVMESVSPDPMQCSIRTISETADAQTSLYEVTLYIPEGIEPAIGAFADITLYTDRRDSTIQIPTEAILTDGEEQYVFVVDGDMAKRVVVSTGLVGDGVTEITSGLSGGETLVTKGQSYLSDGSIVRIVGGEE